ncbi:HAD family hydrolase [Streptomyces cinereospinus]|uniref:HAD family hydrolase n=1 Tax=Streptomyces cinereospinus TaxID=285561 RepID=A0ABV5N6C0_9ACTN
MQPLALFDLDNTLVDRQSTLADWVAIFLVRHGLPGAFKSWLYELLADRATPAHFAEVRDRFGIAEPVDTLWNGYCTDIASTVACPPEVLTGLEELRTSGWRIGVATNGATDIQQAKLRATGIFDRVDAVCISEETGARKPGVAMFQEAVRRCGGAHDGVGMWVVGDDPVNDMAGAREAGFLTVWIDRGRSWPEELPPPDHQVRDARAAIDLLVAIGPVGRAA